MTDTRPVHLLTYAERLGGDLAGVARLLDGPLSDFGGVHLLPFFVPFDGDDAGFDPVDHASVDPRLGTWDDVRTIAADREVTADLIVNHVSSGSAEFADWLERQELSPHDGMFLTFDTVFPDGASEAAITAFYRPRPGLPFTAYRAADGRRRLVWTTFMPSQVDLDVRHPAAVAYLERLLRTLADGGVTTVRLDAVGYAIKTPGSDSFMTDETLAFVRDITALARRHGLRVLVEVHAHYSQQLAIAPLVDLVYDFALPALLLHSLGTGTVDRLTEWFAIRPVNAITVLDTHDGIGIIDAGPSAESPGLISHDEMAAIFERASVATVGHSDIASVIPAWMTLPHQINATFFSALGADPTAYLLCRAVQMFVPGVPQIYYVGLLGGEDDTALFEQTGQGRDVNRHTYSPDEFERALGEPVAQAILGLVRLRSRHPAFDGEFDYETASDGALSMRWIHDASTARLDIVTGPTPSFVVTLTGDEGERRFDSVEALALL
ncbi:sucrose phosphorylase [Herbiconiux sp. L3-i23]|uniref:sucrose phosphorylase n=1 Tax=Herbiconiux sp. L3-i23 TaxID=2905871 RepID=UPI0020485384|nr:sucrose phosphorylase [Herbiconiux sp. L3-i23]BDI21471.1 sucrose phosphorylase [Herbiconiux sp. L3-i23]